jgi:hypothetical protein
MRRSRALLELVPASLTRSMLRIFDWLYMVAAASMLQPTEQQGLQKFVKPDSSFAWRKTLCDPGQFLVARHLSSPSPKSLMYPQSGYRACNISQILSLSSVIFLSFLHAFCPEGFLQSAL